MDAAELRAALEKVVEGLEREVQTKREELVGLERSLDGARSTLNLPPSLLKSALSSKSTTITDREEPLVVLRRPTLFYGGGEAVSVRGAMREAIAALADPFTNADVFAEMNKRYPGAFKPEQTASVSSVMAKFGHKGLIRQLKRGQGDQRAVMWEKVPGKWTDKGVTP
jgi:hypothetical protein